MKKFFKVFLCSLAALLCYNCSKDEEVTTGTITGYVTEYGNANTGIAGATVTLSPSGLTRTTGSDGRYEFTDVQPGNYDIQVAANGFQSNNKNVSVVAAQTIMADIQLITAFTSFNIDPTQLTFGPETNQQSFTITNDSERALQYSISNYPAYVTVSPASAQIAAKSKQAVMVTINRSAITSSTNAQMTVTVGNDSRTVSLYINTQDVSAKMQVTPKTLDFGEVYSQLQFTIRNVGTAGDLSWNILEPTSKLFSVDRTSGTLPMGSSTQITVTLNRKEMTENIPSAFINVNTDGGTETVTLTALKAGAGESGEEGEGTIPGAIVVTSGLQCYYPFDDGTADDVTDYELDAYLYNGTTMIDDTPNGRGKALFINSNKGQNMTIPYNPIESGRACSVTMWVKEPSAGILFGMTSNNGDTWYVPTYCLNPSNELRIYNNTGSSGSLNSVYNGELFNYNTSTIQDGGWHMLTFIRSGNKAQLYVDGKLVSNTNVNSASYFSGNSMMLTCGMKVDNVRLYNREISKDEVNRIYNSER